MTTTLTPPNIDGSTLCEAATNSLLGATAGELVLRLNNGPQAGRIVRLTAAKCTIGSSPDCTLRLRGAGIEPVHCVIVRGARQTVVRRWSNDTRVNDRHFEDLSLRDGDRLAVGPVEFQILKAPSQEISPVRTARRVENELAAATARIETITQRLDLANRQGRRRLRSVLARLRKYQLRLNDIEGRRSLLTQEQERLHAETARLVEKNAELEARKLEWEQEREAWQKQIGETKQDAAALDAEQARVHHAEQKLRDREADLVGRITALEDRSAHLAAGERKLAARESELARQADELRKQAEKLESREAETAARLSEIESRQKEAALRLSEIVSREGETERRWNEAQSRDADATRRVSEIEVRETEVAAVAEAARRMESEVAARCEALKNHWSELIERERALEQELERLSVREQELIAAREAAAAVTLATSAPAVVEPAQAIETAPTVDLEAAAELQRQLGFERNALNVQQERLASEQERLTAEQERLIAESAEIERLRVDFKVQESELLSRRATLELAARVIDRRAEFAESAEAEVAESMQALASAKIGPAAQLVAHEASLEDRLRIEKLEALVKTWRNEAELWKSRFDEIEFGDKVGTPDDSHSDRDADSVPHEDPTQQPETDVHLTQPIGDVAVQDEVEADDVAEAAPEVEETATEIAPPTDETEEPVTAEAVEVPKEVKAESAAEVLRRLGMAAALEDNTPAAVAPPAPAPLPMPQPKAAEHHEGDESLDDYMQQLFQRLGVKQQAPAAPASSVASSSQPQNSAKSDVEVQAAKPAEPVVQQAPLLASEFKARSVAAERNSDLSALRELANNTAKAAIAKHQVKTQSTKSKWKLMTAAGSLAIAGVSAWSYFVLGFDGGKYAIVGGLALTVYSVFQSAGLKHNAAKSARSLDDVLQKSAGRAPTKETVE